MFLRGYLVCPADEVEIVFVEEFGNDFRAERERNASVVLAPSSHVLKITRSSTKIILNISAFLQILFHDTFPFRRNSKYWMILRKNVASDKCLANHEVSKFAVSFEELESQSRILLVVLLVIKSLHRLIGVILANALATWLSLPTSCSLKFHDF